MATKKPVIQIVLDEEIYEKLKALSKEQDRSISKQGARIIKAYFEQIENLKSV